jgi:hypothetical protein
MLVRGDQLSESARRQVLAAFGYRWTIENESRARYWCRQSGANPPRIPLIPDEQWLREHAFHVVQDGSRLMKNRSHAEPACMLEDGATP